MVLQNRNHELFKFYNAELPTPDSYVDASWAFLISAALQRRVWIASGMKVFPNQYIFLVAPPGVGKSITSVVANMLNYWKLDGTPRPEVVTEASMTEKPRMMFPVSATSTTYAKFVEMMSSLKTMQLHKVPGGKPYAHCSTTFVLDELTSIFKKDANEMMSFLLEGWTCSDDYSNETIGRGVNLIRNMCINIIGGTQPDKFAGMKNLELISSGFTRRAVIIYERESRSSKFLIPEHTPEQKKARDEILLWLKKLHTLYGPVIIDPGAAEWLNEWFEDKSRVRTNKSPYLDYYYASKQVHIHKMAMALHFGESTEMVLPLSAYQRAIALLERFEKTMHMAFAPKASNDAADVKADVIRMLENLGRPANAPELYTAFDRKIKFVDFIEALSDLQVSCRVAVTGKGEYKLVERKF